MFYLLLTSAIAFSILASFHDKFIGDVSVITWFQNRQSDITTDFMKTVTFLGQSWIIFGLAGITAVVLFILHRKREGFAAIAVLFSLSLSPLLKLLVDRPRPPADTYRIIDPVSGLSFPSGHGYQSFVFLGFLVYLAMVFIGNTWIRRSIQVLLVFFILAIGISRIYLGVHWPSDVIGAYLIGGSVLWIILRFYNTGTSTADS